MSEDSPYLSVVVVSRNDDHGGNPLQRTQLCINSLYEQCNRYKLSVELIIVDWNPPFDRPGLSEVIEWPKNHRFISARVISVPPEFHHSLPHSKNLQLFQMIGKNVGIRRAKGEYVLATNIDIIFSDELMEYLSKRSLREGCSYRVDRFDIKNDILNGVAEDVKPDYLNNIIRVNIKIGTFSNAWIGKAGRFINPLFDAIMLIFGNRIVISLINFFVSVLEYLLDLLRIVFNYFKHGILIFLRILRKISIPGRPFSPVVAIFTSVTGKIRVLIDKFINQIKAFSNSFLSRLNSRRHTPKRGRSSLILLYSFFLYRLKMYVGFGLPFIHMNGCGDFTLLSKKDWDKLGGYLEKPIFSWHLDSLFLIDAHYFGIREVYLQYPKVIFHVEHGTGSGWTPGKGEQLLFDRLEESGIPYLGWVDCLEYSKKRWEDVEKAELRHIIKNMDYGFFEYNFPEISI